MEFIRFCLMGRHEARHKQRHSKSCDCVNICRIVEWSLCCEVGVGLSKIWTTNVQYWPWKERDRNADEPQSVVDVSLWFFVIQDVNFTPDTKHPDHKGADSAEQKSRDSESSIVCIKAFEDNVGDQRGAYCHDQGNNGVHLPEFEIIASDSSAVLSCLA